MIMRSTVNSRVCIAVPKAIGASNGKYLVFVHREFYLLIFICFFPLVSLLMFIALLCMLKLLQYTKDEITAFFLCQMYETHSNRSSLADYISIYLSISICVSVLGICLFCVSIRQALYFEHLIFVLWPLNERTHTTIKLNGISASLFVHVFFSLSVCVSPLLVLISLYFCSLIWFVYSQFYSASVQRKKSPVRSL